MTFRQNTSVSLNPSPFFAFRRRNVPSGLPSRSCSTAARGTGHVRDMYQLDRIKQSLLGPCRHARHSFCPLLLRATLCLLLRDALPPPPRHFAFPSTICWASSFRRRSANLSMRRALRSPTGHIEPRAVPIQSNISARVLQPVECPLTSIPLYISVIW